MFVLSVFMIEREYFKLFVPMKFDEKNFFDLFNKKFIFKYLIKQKMLKIQRKFFSDQNKKLIKKFYKNVNIETIRETEQILEKKSQIDKFFLPFSKNEEFYLKLDNRRCKSLYLDEYIIPSKHLAICIAEEFASQGEYINFHRMPLVLNFF